MDPTAHFICCIQCSPASQACFDEAGPLQGQHMGCSSFLLCWVGGPSLGWWTRHLQRGGSGESHTCKRWNNTDKQVKEGKNQLVSTDNKTKFSRKEEDKSGRKDDRDVRRRWGGLNNYYFSRELLLGSSWEQGQGENSWCLVFGSSSAVGHAVLRSGFGSLFMQSWLLS